MESEEPTTLSSFTSVPHEVIFDILKNLPIKTLLRCMAVCKEWNSIINGKSFIKTHLLSQPEGHLFSHFFEQWYRRPSSTSDKTQLCSFFPDDSFSLLHKFEDPLPYSSRRPCRILVGSLDGLLLITNLESYGRELYLWNPSIRKHKTLPGSCLFNGKYNPSYFNRRIFVLGLGFRAPTSDYIIIRFSFVRGQQEPLAEAEIYSLSTDSWEKVGFSEDVSTRLRNISRSPSVYVNGDLNWMAMFSDGEGRPYESILSFDVNKKEFRETRLPNDFRNGIDIFPGISIHRGFLAILLDGIAIPKDGIDPILPRIAIHRGLLAVVLDGIAIPEDGNWYVRLWTMEVDSWRRTTVKTTTGRPRALLGCTLDGRIMFKKGDGRESTVELLDMETLQEQQFNILGFDEYVHAFKETLISP